MRINLPRLKQVLKDNNITQTALSIELNLNEGTLSRVMTGKSPLLSLYVVVRICDYAKITDIRELLTYEKDPLKFNRYKIK